MKLINLTPHAINIRTAEGELIVPPSGTVARVSTSPGSTELMNVEGHRVTIGLPTHYGPVEGLPPFEDWTRYIVSGVVGAHRDVVGRGDVLVPGTGPNDNPVRDAAGRIIAVTRLNQV